MTKEDVNTEEVEETPSEEESSPTTEDKAVPYERFQEVVQEKNELRNQLQEIGSDIKSLKKQESSSTGLTEQQQAELRAKEYLQELIKDTLQQTEQERKAQAEAERKQFDTQVNSVLELNPTVKRGEFLKFIEEKGDAYGIESVQGAMALYKDLQNTSKEVAQRTAKDIAAKPGLPSHEGGTTGGRPESDIGKSLDEIADDVVKQL